MQKEIEIKILPEKVDNQSELLKLIIAEFPTFDSNFFSYKIIKKSIDARRKPIYFVLKIAIFSKDLSQLFKPEIFSVCNKKFSKTCHIIGFGPAGIFAALHCLENGIKPIIIERGKQVEERIKDISSIHKNLSINADSNYCFGEGGAGTYSDGKLYTRSTKRGNLKKVLDTLVYFGADPSISIDAHPHIGTNKLPKLIAAIRNAILLNGGEIIFNAKLIDFTVSDNKITEINLSNGETHSIDQLILATGHSARDIYYLLHKKNILLEAKPYAIGVRIEHPQELIDSIQYKCDNRGAYLPPSSYSLVEQVNGRGVFSFCMCPGGVICPAGTADGELVVNGWSSSRRNGFFANSGMVVSVNNTDWRQYEKFGALAGLKFQENIEKNAFSINNSIVSPAQRVEDFIQNKISTDLPRTSYQPGITSDDLRTYLPPFVANSIANGIISFGNKMKGYRTNEAILVGLESRTSSPVRIPRDKQTFRHPQIKNLIPCGEGAGYAGGIISAALDGMACAQSL